MDHLGFIACRFMENSIALKRVNSHLVIPIVPTFFGLALLRIYCKKERKQELGCKQGFQYTPATLCSFFNWLQALIDQNNEDQK